MNIWTKLYVNSFTLYKAPKSYIKYSLYCVLQNKEPDVNMLARIIQLSKIIKSIKTESKLVISSSNKQDIKIVYTNKLATFF